MRHWSCTAIQGNVGGGRIRGGATLAKAHRQAEDERARRSARNGEAHHSDVATSGVAHPRSDKAGTSYDGWLASNLPSRGGPILPFTAPADALCGGAAALRSLDAEQRVGNEEKAPSYGASSRWAEREPRGPSSSPAPLAWKCPIFRWGTASAFQCCLGAVGRARRCRQMPAERARSGPTGRVGVPATISDIALCSHKRWCRRWDLNPHSLSGTGF